MSQFDYDLFVIGAGSGGVRAARMAAGFGARVAIAENYRIGGTCVIRGCIPKKLLSYASHFSEDFEDARGYGWQIDGARFSWPALIASKNAEIARLSGIYANLLKQSGVTLLVGKATLADAHTVAVDGRKVTANNILVATGGWPSLPAASALPGIEHAITSNEAFELPDLPRRILIVGGGYIAVEFAGIFRGLGAAVTISYRGEQILRGFDADIRQHLHGEITKKGVNILLGSKLHEIKRRPDRAYEVSLAGVAEPVVVDAVMYATGRAANTTGLGLAEAGVELDATGGVIVDRYCRSSVEHIYAVGDVTNRIALTPVAIREGSAVASTLFGGVPTLVDHDDVPSAVFSQPPIGTVGLTEESAVEKLGEVDIYKTTFKPLKHTLSGRDERTMMKLVVDSKTGRVVGAHMAGADAPEIIQGIAIAVKAGLTKREFDQIVAIHPTAAEEFVTLKDKRVVRAKG